MKRPRLPYSLEGREGGRGKKRREGGREREGGKGSGETGTGYRVEWKVFDRRRERVEKGQGRVRGSEGEREGGRGSEGGRERGREGVRE